MGSKTKKRMLIKGKKVHNVGYRPFLMEKEDDIMTLEEYSSVFSALQLSKIAQAGLGMIEMQKQTLGKQDETIAAIGEVSRKIDIGKEERKWE
ncbi:MAG: hypothetical protein WA977_02205 [Halobacteriota archaeon]